MKAEAEVTRSENTFIEHELSDGVVSCYSYGDYSAVSMVNVAVRMVYFTA